MYFPSKWFALAIALVPPAACAGDAASPAPIATVKFDVKGKHEWYSFPPIPKETVDWPERNANKTFPWINVKTPTTRHLCVWRDIGRTESSRDPKVKPDVV